jgi:glyoxylase-like metal-dependent hydrolase (beta-lactamase superfamily II)
MADQKIFTSFFDDPWKVKMLTKDLGIFTERGGTIAFMLAKKGIVVVDAQFPDTAPHLIAEVKKRSQKPFKMLINTHHHGDHTAGNIAFKGVVEHVMAHENSLKNQRNVAAQQKTEDKQLFPDQTFSDTSCNKVAKEKICLYYFGKGHTDGDIMVHFEEDDVVHMGDLVFNRRHPFVDRSAGANIKSWMTVLDQALMKFGDKHIYICGHAETGYEVTANADDVKAFRDYLGNVLKFVEGEMKAGKTRDEILKATAIPGSPEWKVVDGIQRPLGAAFDELNEKA